MAKLGKLITDLSVNGPIVCIQFECSDDATAKALYDGLREGIQRGRITLTSDGAETIEEISVQ